MPTEGVEAILPEAAFDYFAREVLATLDEDGRRFLVQSALLPKFTVSTLKSLTAEQRSEQLLRGLQQHNCFIRRYQRHGGVYCYHPVFRRFLLSQLPQALGATAQRSLQRRAMTILERNGALDEAASLLVELGDQEELARLLKVAAPQLLDQGRHRQLADWIGALPERVMARSPELQCWWALSVLPSDPRAARTALQTLYPGFRSPADVEWRCRAGFGIVQSYWLERNDFHPLRDWLNKLWPTWEDYGANDSERQSDYALVGVYTALMLIDPGHSAAPDCERLLLRLIAGDANRQLRLFACILLLFRSSWLGGGRELAEKALGHLRALVVAGSTDPIAEITRAYGEALYQY